MKITQPETSAFYIGMIFMALILQLAAFFTKVEIQEDLFILLLIGVGFDFMIAWFLVEKDRETDEEKT